MIDSNEFKKEVKVWMRSHPNASEQDLIDFCEEMIPPSQFSASKWLIDQTISWYRYVVMNKEYDRSLSEESEDIA